MRGYRLRGTTSNSASSSSSTPWSCCLACLVFLVAAQTVVSQENCGCVCYEAAGFVTPCMNNARCYVANYLDVANNDLEAAKSHWASTGLAENRVRFCPSDDADWQCYIDKYGLTQLESVAAAKEHFFTTGYINKHDPYCPSVRFKAYSGGERGEGNLQNGYHGSVTVAQCEQLCLANEDCASFAFTSGGDCYLKGSDTNEFSTNADVNFYSRLPDYFTVEGHGERAGGDVGPCQDGCSTSTVDECAEKCRENFGCDSFSYNTGQNSCYTKNTENGMDSSYDTNSGYQMYVRTHRTAP